MTKSGKIYDQVKSSQFCWLEKNWIRT